MKFFLAVCVALLFACAPLLFATLRAAQPLRECFLESKRFIQALSEDRTYTQSEVSNVQGKLTTCVREFQTWDQTASAYLRLPYVEKTIQAVFPKQLALLQQARVFSPLINQIIRLYPTIVGVQGEKRYIILLQNDTEIRPTGGFIGSFVYVVFKDGKLSVFQPEDIYVPDGQLKGYVKPPAPVETYLYQKGGWKLRDSNWNPDFPQAVETMLWFFDKGGYQHIDGVVTITLSAVQEYLQILGPLYLPDYDKTVGADELYAFAQSQTEQGFFPGASNKRDVLGALTRSFTRSVKELHSEQYQAIAHLFLNHLASKDIMIWSRDDDVKEFVELHQWDGKIRVPQCSTTRCRVDYLYLVEANVGINKANCCIDRKVVYQVWLNENGTATSSATIAYTNNNPVTPQPPKHYGGGYNNFLRVFRDPLWSLSQVRRDDVLVDASVITGEFDQVSNATSSGMLADVGGGESHTFTYFFQNEKRIDYASPQQYILNIQKQPGIRTHEYEILIHSPATTNITHVDSPTFFESSRNSLRMHPTVDRDLTISFTVSPQ